MREKNECKTHLELLRGLRAVPPSLQPLHCWCLEEWNSCRTCTLATWDAHNLKNRICHGTYHTLMYVNVCAK